LRIATAFTALSCSCRTYSGLVTYEATGAEVDEAARQLRQMPAAAAAAVLGRSVHIAGIDRTTLERAIAAFGDHALRWHEVEPRLEDAFIHSFVEPVESARSGRM
jgi:ABC-2 type transport system ATP-binding protein